MEVVEHNQQWRAIMLDKETSREIRSKTRRVLMEEWDPIGVKSLDVRTGYIYGRREYGRTANREGAGSFGRYQTNSRGHWRVRWATRRPQSAVRADALRHWTGFRRGRRTRL
jgi:hypothetical protein